MSYIHIHDSHLPVTAAVAYFPAGDSPEFWQLTMKRGDETVVWFFDTAERLAEARPQCFRPR